MSRVAGNTLSWLHGLGNDMHLFVKVAGKNGFYGGAIGIPFFLPFFAGQ